MPAARHCPTSCAPASCAAMPLPYYDDAALRVLRGFERAVYQQLR
jgi:hypothetical protein